MHRRGNVRETRGRPRPTRLPVPYSAEAIASTPNPAITAPEMRDTHTSADSLMAWRTAATTLTSATHHDNEPSATPIVAVTAVANEGAATSPALANTAPNAMIVIGLVSVSATAEA